jgi:outer membrane murein-binding lipoprotein Lpp
MHRLLATVLLLAALTTARGVSAATPDELEARVDALAAQVVALQSEVAALKSEKAAAAAGAPQAMAPTPSSPPEPQVQWFGYGELNYSRPTGDASAATADVARFVLGASYAFDDRTRFVSELELEHAVSSADDPGEVEVEQAYIERRLSEQVFAKAGLFLIPVGMLNENHEPTRYYGVFRNFVETAIVPTTWREGGFAVQGNTAGGLRWDAGISTGFNLSKWDATSEEGLEEPLGSIHQELALASAGDLSVFGALNYSGVPGLRLGASVFSGEADQGQPGFDDNRVTLWEGHARWNPGNWDLSALYAHGSISNTAAINTTLVGNPALIPENFFGWYVEAAYRATLPNEWTLAPFARYEVFNTASGYASIGAGLTPDPLEDEKVFTAGFNLDIARGVVFKIDYLHFDREDDANRVDLGLGYQF